jgi:hypothetical protein
VGIGTTSPTSKLTVAGNTSIQDGAGYGWAGLATYVGGSSASNFINFTTTSTERMRIDSSGNVGIGTSSPTNTSGYTTLQLNNATNGGMLRISNGTQTYWNYVNSGGAYLGTSSNHSLFIQTNNTTQVTIDTSGNVGIGTISPTSNAGVTTLQVSSASSSSRVIWESQSTSRKVGWFLDSANNFGVYDYTGASERMRIDTSGNLLVNTTTVLNNARVTVVNANPQIVARHSSATAGKYWNTPYIDTNNTLYIINQNNAGVYITDGATAWVANSDERLKDIIAPITSALEGVQSLRAVKYSWKSDADKVAHIGLIAQDVQKVLPEVVASAKLPLSEDETEYLSVAYTEVIPLLVAAIKELSAEVEALKAKVGA